MKVATITEVIELLLDAIGELNSSISFQMKGVKYLCPEVESRAAHMIKIAAAYFEGDSK